MLIPALHIFQVYEAVLEMEFNKLSDTEESGLVILQSNEYHILFRIKNKDNQTKEQIALQVFKCLNKEDTLLAEKLLTQAELKKEYESDIRNIKIKIKGHGQKADFILLTDEKEIPIISDVDIHEMSTDVAGGFVGNTIGVYASSNGRQSDNYVEAVEFTIRY